MDSNLNATATIPDNRLVGIHGPLATPAQAPAKQAKKTKKVEKTVQELLALLAELKQPTASLDGKLVDIHGLLDALFGPTNRPSPRWIQYQMARRTIPFLRIGRLIRFDPVAVRAALNTGCLVCAKVGQRVAKAKCVATSTVKAA